MALNRRSFLGAIAAAVMTPSVLAQVSVTTPDAILPETKALFKKEFLLRGGTRSGKSTAAYIPLFTMMNGKKT